MIGCGICNPTNVNCSTQKITYYAGLDVIALIPCLIFISTQNNFNNLPRSGDLCSRCLEINMQIRQQMLARENYSFTLYYTFIFCGRYRKGQRKTILFIKNNFLVQYFGYLIHNPHITFINDFFALFQATQTTRKKVIELRDLVSNQSNSINHATIGSAASVAILIILLRKSKHLQTT